MEIITLIGSSLQIHFIVEFIQFGVKATHFPQLISVVECKVSFESMRVLENNVLRGMIYIENIEIWILNIENYNSCMASAVTLCTYLGYRYYPFEIANIEIIWGYKLLISARPIIQLSGKVSRIPLKCKIIGYFIIWNRSTTLFNQRCETVSRNMSVLAANIKNLLWCLSYYIIVNWLHKSQCKTCKTWYFSMHTLWKEHILP